MKIIKFFVCISIVFLVIGLYKAEYLHIPTIVNAYALAGSLLILFLAFFFEAVVWKKLLKMSNVSIHLKESLTSVGLSVFGKYIPGKIWMLIGKAAYIAKMKSIPVAELSFISVKMQLIMSWLGLIIGSIGLIIYDGLNILGVGSLFLWCGLTLILFSNFGINLLELFSNSFLNKEIKLPILSAIKTLQILPVFVVNWALYSIAFYLLIKALVITDVSLSVGLGFPLAITIGVFAVFIPAGIGAREGVLIAFLLLAGIQAKDATTISIASRLWFLLGEFFIFFVGTICNSYIARK